MYQNGLVVAVKINNKTVEEKNGKVVLPFDSEYSLMLKNRNDRKAVARIYIDGEEVTEKGRLIIDANGSVNIERFIDDMDKGKRFKFVPISDNRVNDKGDCEKGFIEVRFQLVKPVLNNVVIHEEHIYHNHHHHHDWDTWPYRGPFYVDYIWPAATINCGVGTLTTNNNNNTSLSVSNSPGALMSYCCSANLSDAKVESVNKATIQDNHLVEEMGATIKGSNSSQRFSYAYVGELESQETVMRFQLIGTRDEKIADQYLKTHCTQCGKAYDTNDVFCAKCGTKK